MEGNREPGEVRRVIGRRRPAAIGLVAAAGAFAVIALVSTATQAAAAGAGPPTSPAGPGKERRAKPMIPVTVLAHPSMSGNAAWKVDITRVFMDVSQNVREALGAPLRIRALGYLDADKAPAVPRKPGSPSLRPYLPVLRAAAARLEGELADGILVGLVPEGPDGPLCPGLADYPNGIIVLKYLEAKGGMPFVLLHELCHLFGAIDLEEPGSVMSFEGAAFRIDRFTREIMDVNRDRSFRRGTCPLTLDRAAEALALYGGREALHPGEPELKVCLDELRAMVASRR